MVEKRLTNPSYILLSVSTPAIVSNPDGLSLGIEEGGTGRNFSRNSSTGIGPTKHALISGFILLCTWASGSVVAAHLVEQFYVLFTGVAMVSMTENKPTARARSAYLLQPRFAFYRVDGRVA